MFVEGGAPTSLKPDLSEFSFSNLSYLLRHREYWPENCPWDFQYYSSCAMGLAKRVWSVSAWEECARLTSPGVANRLFCTQYRSGSVSFYQKPVFFGLFWRNLRGHEVTPEMVADAIDRYVLAAK
jgi:hypothetical protein